MPVSDSLESLFLLPHSLLSIGALLDLPLYTLSRHYYPLCGASSLLDLVVSRLLRVYFASFPEILELPLFRPIDWLILSLWRCNAISLLRTPFEISNNFRNFDTIAILSKIEPNCPSELSHYFIFRFWSFIMQLVINMTTFFNYLPTSSASSSPRECVQVLSTFWVSAVSKYCVPDG